MTGLDRWILCEFSKLEEAVATAYDAFEFHVVYQKISQFVAVELSAIYHDVVKDRLYTRAANSRRRRSTQTALHRMASGLCSMLSPVLAFTADEAWEFLPGRPCPSVHLASWTPAKFELPDEEQTVWKNLFEIRELALSELEKARQAKTIGKALDAKLTLSGPESPALASPDSREVLRELLNVSQLDFAPKDGPLSVTVSRAEGAKCERCWHYEVEVGANAQHPTICARCVEAVG
jgi:isoleucyl-tRNA synthetase